MTILGVQILGVLFALFMIYITFLHQRRNEFTAKESIFWFGTWICFLLLVIFPIPLDFFIKDVLDFGRRMDFYIVIGFMFLIGTTFYIYVLVRIYQNKVDKLVRKIAIDDGMDKKENNPK